MGIALPRDKQRDDGRTDPADLPIVGWFSEDIVIRVSVPVVYLREQP